MTRRDQYIPARSVRLRFLLVLACCTAIGAALPVALNAARAPNTTFHLDEIRIKSGETFSNYDFIDPGAADTGLYGNPAKVDWPVNLVFWDRGHRKTVWRKMASRSLPFGGFRFEGGRMWGRVSEDGKSHWTKSDKGRKTIQCPANGQTAIHYRIYADGNNRLDNARGLKNFVIGTSHVDFNECGGPGGFSGKSEDAERYIRLAAKRAFGRGNITPGFDDYRNEEMPPENIDGHYWQNSGRPTAIRVERQTP